MNTKTNKIAKCIYCHTPLIESDSSKQSFYCSDFCKHETGLALKEFFEELGSDLGTGG